MYKNLPNWMHIQNNTNFLCIRTKNKNNIENFNNWVNKMKIVTYLMHKFIIEESSIILS